MLIPTVATQLKFARSTKFLSKRKEIKDNAWVLPGLYECAKVLEVQFG